ncbi:MAG TPA: hypothetical protein GX392_02505 [Clostridiales bacterium]|nr:hypothetical protein [Clostridiales bacterium]
MVENFERYFKEDPNASYHIDGRKYWQSVHGKSYSRYNKSVKEIQKPTVPKDKIIEYINELLETIGVKSVEYPIMNPADINYESLQRDFELDDIGDIVWIKFTTDGFVGVVAVSNDINFDIPTSSAEYDEKVWKYDNNTKKKVQSWKYNSSGILVHKLKKEWDRSFVLVFPLSKLKTSCKYTRHEIEMAIGNYLTKGKNVPIIDYYSHNIG